MNSHLHFYVLTSILTASIEHVNVQGSNPQLYFRNSGRSGEIEEEKQRERDGVDVNHQDTSFTLEINKDK